MLLISPKVKITKSIWSFATVQLKIWLYQLGRTSQKFDFFSRGAAVNPLLLIGCKLHEY